MQLYKASLKLKSSLVTPLKGDTIWGHIVWGIANHEGEDAVKKFLDAEKNSDIEKYQDIDIQRKMEFK